MPRQSVSTLRSHQVAWVHGTARNGTGSAHKHKLLRHGSPYKVMVSVSIALPGYTVSLPCPSCFTAMLSLRTECHHAETSTTCQKLLSTLH